MIKFGTDGWRGIIAQDFTFENVRVVARAVADYLKNVSRVKCKVSGKKPLHLTPYTLHLKVVVGYDTRFLSDKFAMAVSRVLAGNGIKVILSSRVIPSPAVSYSVVNEKANLGVMITASHNPPCFNGLKIKVEFGASADEKITGAIEKFLFRNKPGESSDGITIRDLIPAYLKKVGSLVDMKFLKKSRLSVVNDPMFGAGAGLLTEILKDTGCRIFNIHSIRDPIFGGLNPEPIKKNLGDLIKETVGEKADIGIATDGDADRIGLVDDRGRYLTPHQVFPLLLAYLIEDKRLRGKVVQTISLGYLGERIANFYGLSFQEVPVGFKYVAQLMRTEDILAGGEESGGFTFRGFIPERDGVLISLVFLEMIARKKKKLSQILDDLEHRFGKSCYDRLDVKMESQVSSIKCQDLKEKMTKAIIKRAPTRIAGMKVREVKTYDGVKFILGSSDVIGGQAWLLLRPSGTEPLVRIYAEADSSGKVQELLRKGKRMVKGVGK